MRFKNFEQVLDTFREEPVIIYFTTAKCGPCQLMKKELEVVRKMIGDELKMFSIDTEKWPQVGSRFQVARLPCLVVFSEGEIKLRLEGVNKAESVVEQVRTLLL
jgi:thioredoxin-like negative regulator of GroEL